MKEYKPKFKQEDLTAMETINRQFVNSFPRLEKREPRAAWETCDLHLSSDQPMKFVDPVGNGKDEITWSEPMDMQMFFQRYENAAWGIVAFASILFLFLIYYWWF